MQNYTNIFIQIYEGERKIQNIQNNVNKYLNNKNMNAA